MYINNIYLFKTFLASCPFWVTWISPWGYIFHSLPLSCDFTVTSKTSRLISLGREHVKPNIHCNLELASRISFDLEELWSKSKPVCWKVSALSQEPRIHYFEKLIQTSYFGTDFPLLMIPICHLYLFHRLTINETHAQFSNLLLFFLIFRGHKHSNL